MRGGGGGTFGIVTSVTFRTLPEVPTVVASLDITAPSGVPGFWESLSEIHRALPSLNDAGGGGFYTVIPNLPVNESASMAIISTKLIFANHSNVVEIDKLFEPLKAKLAGVSGIMSQFGSFSLPSIKSTLSNVFSNKQPIGGEIGVVASRLYSKDLLLSEDGPERLTNALESLEYEPGRALAGCVVAGGAVAANGRKISSALNPAWRRAITHLIVTKTWSPDTTFERQSQIVQNITQVELPILKSVEGAQHMGAYMNEASPEEINFQASFWGNNYHRLYKIKQDADPEGLFITRLGVGSEDWDETGFCRRRGER